MFYLLQDFNQLLKNKLGDSHLHTNWTDGENTIREMMDIACKIGLEWIMFSEHNREKSDYSYSSFIDEIIEQSSFFKNLTVIKGAECKIKNFKGDLDISDEALEFSDIITGVVHRFPGEKGNIIKSPINTFAESQKKEALEIERQLMLAGIKSRKFSVLGHPYGMSIKRFGLLPSLDNFKELMIACKNNNVIFELNLNYHSKLLNNLVNMLKRYDASWTIGSNSHSCQDLRNSWEIFRLKRITL